MLNGKLKRPSELLAIGWCTECGAKRADGRPCAAVDPNAISWSIEGAIWAVTDHPTMAHSGNAAARAQLQSALEEIIKETVSSATLHRPRVFNNYFLRTGMEAVAIMQKVEARCAELFSTAS